MWAAGVPWARSGGGAVRTWTIARGNHGDPYQLSDTFGCMSAATTAAASFKFEAWEEEPVVNDGNLRLYRTHFQKVFEGEMQGRSEGDMLMVHVGDQPTAYCGFELVRATLAGRTGAFLFHHNAGAGIEGGLSLTVVPRSGSGQLEGLEGLEGSARIEIAGEVGDTTAPHTLILDYRLA